MSAAHHNTDRSNAYCYCPIGRDHGNLPADERHQIVTAMLRNHDVIIETDRGGTRITKTATSPMGWGARARRTLESYGINAGMPGGEVYIPAEVFNR